MCIQHRKQAYTWHRKRASPPVFFAGILYPAPQGHIRLESGCADGHVGIQTATSICGTFFAASNEPTPGFWFEWEVGGIGLGWVDFA